MTYHLTLRKKLLGWGLLNQSRYVTLSLLHQVHPHGMAKGNAPSKSTAKGIEANDKSKCNNPPNHEDN